MKDQLKQAIIDGNEGVALAMTQALLATGASAREILDEALLPGMEVVGARMREGECFIPEVLLTARVMQACLDLLRPHMAAGEEAGMGMVVHRHRRGRPARHRQEPRRHAPAGRRLHGRQPRHRGHAPPTSSPRSTSTRPQILGMSALLTTTLPHMSETIAALKDAGLRDAVKVMVGGAPVTAAYAEEIGADGYGANAGMAVERAKELVG